MKTRAITGFFFIIVMLASVLTGQYSFVIFFILLSLFSLDEFYRLIQDHQIKPQRLSGLLLALAIFIPVGIYLNHGSGLRYLALSIPLLIASFVAELYRKQEKPFQNLALTVFGVVYVVLPFCLFAAAAFLSGDYNFHIPLATLLLLWANDTGAYLFGIKLGKNKLFERHSPKKTWEGFFGGMFTSLLVSFILSTQYVELAPIHWALLSLIIVIAGTFGDLGESMLKRSVDKKDSGSLLPGHGGLLDRFDGLLFSAPLVFVYLYLLLEI